MVKLLASGRLIYPENELHPGLVNGADFADLAANFNQGVSGADVPGGDVAALDAFATANGLPLPTSGVP
ncbi:MAG: hypothetical protein ABSB74_01675 [Tepidisphaeraceae bacterium]